MEPFSLFIWALLSFALSTLVLYVIIRLAVTHAIRAAHTPARSDR